MRLRMFAARCVALVVLANLGAALSANAQDRPQPSGVRTLVLIRHGLYDETDPRDPEVGKRLTPDGREQARLTGERLTRFNVTIDALHTSPMVRARETAMIIGEALTMTPEIYRDIRECTPPTIRKDIMERETMGGPDSCAQQIDRAWARFFRPSPVQDSTEVVVCHGNIIRSLVARAVGLKPDLWLNMAIANCSISVIQVAPDGRTRLVSFADSGHLPGPIPRWNPPATAKPGQR